MPKLNPTPFITRLRPEALVPSVASSGERLGAQFDVSRAAGFEKLRVSFDRVPPGARQSLPHAHSTREELLYVLKGSGTLVAGEESWPVEAGDLVCLRPGDDALHTLVNRSEEDLDLLIVSSEDGLDEVRFGPR
ncbi:MAG: cupin domain-containing protein [Myxococcota bacterium]